MATILLFASVSAMVLRKMPLLLFQTSMQLGWQEKKFQRKTRIGLSSGPIQLEIMILTMPQGVSNQKLIKVSVEKFPAKEHVCCM